MEIIRCDKGHFYDAEQSATCPTCAKAGAVDNNVFSFDTAPNMSYPTVEAITPTAPADIMGTEAFVSSAPDSMGSADAFMSTPPMGGFSPMMGGMSPAPMAPQASQGATAGIEDYQPTTPVPMSKPAAGGADVSAANNFNPVVGWLVCIDGACKGADFRIHSQYNYIGRAHSMDICISGDSHISAERAAIIAYDDQEKLFSFGPGSGHNIVRVNGKMVMNAVQLNAYDELTVGLTKLLFVPLCSERFDWNDK